VGFVGKGKKVTTVRFDVKKKIARRGDFCQLLPKRKRGGGIGCRERRLRKKESIDHDLFDKKGGRRKEPMSGTRGENGSSLIHDCNERKTRRRAPT